MRYLRIVTIVIFLAALALGGWTEYKLSQRDSVSPEIYSSIEELHLSVQDDDGMLLKGLTASDDRDGDLTDKILVEKVSRFKNPGECEVSYVVFDSESNFCRYQRTVKYDDYKSPRLRLKQPLMYRLGEQIAIMDRFELIDCLDGDITYKLKLESSNVPDDKVGVYEIEVLATNNYGDDIYAKIPLNIGVYSADAPIIELKEYLVYTEVGAHFDPLSYIESVRDVENKPISVSEVKVQSRVDLTKSGGGQICYEVTDSRGVSGFMYLVVIVEGAR